MGSTTSNNIKNTLKSNVDVLVIITSLFFLVAMLGYIWNYYHDVTTEKDFPKEAHKVLDHSKIYGYNGGEFVYSNEYMNNVAVATCFQQTDYEFVDDYREYYVDKIVGDIEGNEEDFTAAFFNSAICESSKKTVSLLISYQIAEYHNEKRTVIKEGIKTWIFNKDKGVVIHPEQILSEDYADLAKEALAEKLPEGDFTYNTFMLSDNGITFLFNRSEEGKGIEKYLISYDNCKSWIRDEILNRFIDPRKPMIALTYDDGPGGKPEARIHKYLKQYDAVATFFYSGYMIKGNEDLMKDTVANGWEIGNHTWNHPVLTKCSDEELKVQLFKTNKAIKKACGQAPTVFRPSYGATNKHVNKMADLPVIIWDVDTLDWQSRDADKVFKSVTHKKKLDGKIVLMHSIYPSTADATKKLLPWLEKHGYQTVTISELIKYRYNEEPKKSKIYAGWYD